SAERTARIRNPERETAAARWIEWIVARVEIVRRPDRGLRVGEIRNFGDGHVAVHVRSDVQLVVAAHVLEPVDEREAVESVQAIAVGDRSAFAQLLVAEGERVIGRAIEERHAEAVGRIEEPWVGIGEREEVQAVAGLETDAEVLAFAEEVACGELRLNEKARSFRVAAAELNVVLPLLG